MAYYNVNSATNTIAPIATALQAVPGLITSVKFQDTSNFIFTTPYSNKHVHFNYSTTYGKLNGIHLGDGWTSGASVTNSVQYQYQGDSNTTITQKGQFIVTPDVFCYITRGESATFPVVTLFCKNNSGDFLCLNFVGGTNTTAGVSIIKCANTTQNYDVYLLNFGVGAISPNSSQARSLFDTNGKFYKTDIMLKKDGNIYAGNVVGLKLLTKTWVSYIPTFGYEIKGNDVLTFGGCYKTTNEEFPHCILIENGAI